MIKKLNYFKRIYKAYLTGEDSQLTFWHGTPAVNQECKTDELGQYYMPFSGKADYQAHLDPGGIPMLDYHGTVGLQYNPIAIAQYALGNYNSYIRTSNSTRFDKFIAGADWLVDHLEQNAQGVWVWNHHFDWEYRDTLYAPWYSALSQGQGISCLVRTHQETGKEIYLKAAEKALGSFLVGIEGGGVVYHDQEDYLWLEETIVNPPTHILNGFLWAIWGLYDYYLYTSDPQAKKIFDDGVATLIHYLSSYDTGFWSLYEHSGTKMHMLASPFYHGLHIVQLRVMEKITGEKLFIQFADKWERYQSNLLYRYFALLYKAIFKVLYY